MKLTLISHFYNEEILLPYWINHYLPLVDHAILIDYHSNDTSVDIIKTLAPHWEIRKSKNKYFHAETIDQEVMEIEESISEWKMTLNTTEFLLKKDLKEYLISFEKSAPGFGAISTNGIWMIDTPRTRSMPLTQDPLIFQRSYGFFEKERIPMRIHPKKEYFLNSCSRSRLIHNKKNGNYEPGRHKFNLPHYQDPNLLLLWFAFSPFNFVKERKLNIFKKKSKEYIDEIIRLKGIDYFESMVSQTEDDLEIKFEYFNTMSENLNDNPQYRKELEKFNI